MCNQVYEELSTRSLALSNSKHCSKQPSTKVWFRISLLRLQTILQAMFLRNFLPSTWRHSCLTEPSMLGGTIIPDWSTVFTGALFALTIAICCHALFWRPQKKKSTSIPEKTLIPKKTLILRIEEIPAGIPHETLQHDLESIVYQNPILRKDEITVLQASFVPIDRKTACATAAFHTSLKPADLIKLCQAHIGLPYRFDNKFDGITPLYEASGGADVE